MIPHAYGVTRIHFALSTSNCPMIEYLPMPSWDSLPDFEVEPIFHGEPVPEGGYVGIHRETGPGVSVNEEIFS